MPGLSNLNEKLSSVSRAPERNSAVSLTTVCGSSSLFVQVTVEPALTVSDAGPNMKSLATTIVAAPGLPAANAPGVTVHRSATKLVAIGSNWRSDIDMCSAPQAIVASLSASECGCFAMDTLVMPSILGSCSAGTLSGPGPGPVPAVGCG